MLGDAESSLGDGRAGGDGAQRQGGRAGDAHPAGTFFIGGRSYHFAVFVPLRNSNSVDAHPAGGAQRRRQPPARVPAAAAPACHARRHRVRSSTHPAPASALRLSPASPQPRRPQPKRPLPRRFSAEEASAEPTRERRLVGPSVTLTTLAEVGRQRAPASVYAPRRQRMLSCLKRDITLGPRRTQVQLRRQGEPEDPDDNRCVNAYSPHRSYPYRFLTHPARPLLRL